MSERLFNIPGIGQVMGPADATPEEVAAAMGAPAPEMQSAPEPAPAPAPVMGEPAAAARFAVGQGAGFGFGDEIEAGARTGLGMAGDYATVRDRIRGELKAYREANPGRALGYELGGAVAGPLLMAKGVSMIPRAGKALSTALTGGKTLGSQVATGVGQGVAATAGQAESMEDFTTQAPLAVGMGTVMPAGASVAMTAGRGARRAATKIAGTGVNPYVVEKIKQGAGSVQAMRNAAGTRTNATLAELGGQPLERTAQVLAQTGGKTSGRAADVLMPRADAAQSRIIKAMEILTDGDMDSAYTAMKKIEQTRKAQAEPLYTLARTKAISVTADMRKLLDTPTGQQALKIANRAALDDPDRVIKAGRGLREQDGFILLPKALDFDTAQDIKQALSSSYAAALRSDDAVVRGQIPSLAKIQNRFKEQAYGANRAWEEADTAWSGMSRVADALETGSNIKKMDVDELRDVYKSMTPLERDMLRVGAADSYSKIAEGTTTGRDVSKRLLASKLDQAKLKVITGDDEKKFGTILRAIDDEGRMAAFKNKVFGGSDTVPKAMEAANLTDIGRTSWKDAIIGAVGKNISDSPRSQAGRDKMGDLLFSIGAERDAELMKLLASERRYDRASAAAAQTGLAGVRAGGTFRNQ